MSRIETVIRPFATREVSTPQRSLTPNQRPAPPVILQWGRSGRGKTMGGSYSLTVTYYLDQQVVEKSTSDYALSGSISGL